ncbi:MAG TPA: tail fiber protein [Gammaproteobacteria bacterium]
MSEPFLGEIRMVGFNFAPRGWAFCQGQILSIAQNSALFSLLGTMYGGNGTTTFALPDLRGRAPVGMGNGPGLTPITQGELAGTENVTLLSTQMPMHTHTATAAATFAVAGTPSNATATPSATNNILGASQAGGPPSAAIWSDALNSPVTLGNTETVSVTVEPAGGGQPVPIRDPFLGTNFIIALEGIFPSRN